ncbi:hypothetical protein HanPSC8_Chr02g0050221 [Helianthus annuus]|nr:hypothetical protein HanPSC8_Chr02g0050221 [Helianthus annuus]
MASSKITGFQKYKYNATFFFLIGFFKIQIKPKACNNLQLKKVNINILILYKKFYPSLLFHFLQSLLHLNSFSTKKKPIYSIKTSYPSIHRCLINLCYSSSSFSSLTHLQLQQQNGEIQVSFSNNKRLTE